MRPQILLADKVIPALQAASAEHTVPGAIDDAAIVLVAGATRLQVLDAGVVIDVAVAVDVVVAVEQRLAALAVEPGAQIDARQARTERDRVRSKHRATRLHRIDRRQVHGLRRFLLQLQVRDARIGAGRDAGDRVGQARGGVGAEVVLHDDRTRARLGAHQVAQMALAAPHAADEDQVDRRLDGDATCQPDHRAVGGERRVQRRRHAAIVGVAVEHLEVRRVGSQRLGKRDDLGTRRQRTDGRQRRRELAIDEHQPVAIDRSVPTQAPEQCLRRHAHGRREHLLLERRERSVSPVVQAVGRPALVSEPLDRATPKRAEPGQRRAGQTPGLIRKRREPCCRVHAGLLAACGASCTPGIQP